MFAYQSIGTSRGGRACRRTSGFSNSGSSQQSSMTLSRAITSSIGLCCIENMRVSTECNLLVLLKNDTQLFNGSLFVHGVVVDGQQTHEAGEVERKVVDTPPIVENEQLPLPFSFCAMNLRTRSLMKRMTTQPSFVVNHLQRQRHPRDHNLHLHSHEGNPILVVSLSWMRERRTTDFLHYALDEHLWTFMASPIAWLRSKGNGDNRCAVVDCNPC